MIDPADLSRPVYPCEGGSLSMLDLLRRFREPANFLDGVSRLSDLHLKISRPVCYRFDNDLVPLHGGAPLTAEMAEALILPLLTRAQADRLQAGTADVDAGLDLPEEGLSFRINVFRDREGIACAVRVVPRTLPEPSRLGFPFEETWKEIADLRQGLVIVTGVTGSGKSTTVASLLSHIARTRALRIITLEDPVEYIITGDRALVSQREVGRDVESFEKGLRSALREDPDVVFVGEMRDRETTGLALTAAETGHLVLSTLHTKDARGAATRIVDMFHEERAREVAAQLSLSLAWVLAQRLVPRSGGRGRRVAMEVMKNIPPIANLIRGGRWQQIYSTIEANRKEGLITLERHLADLTRRGEITQETAQRYANDPSLAI